MSNMDTFYHYNINYSTVTDLCFPTQSRKFIPYLRFVCVIIYCKGSIVSTEYKDFDIVFVDKI